MRLIFLFTKHLTECLDMLKNDVDIFGISFLSKKLAHKGVTFETPRDRYVRLFSATSCFSFEAKIVLVSS